MIVGVGGTTRPGSSSETALRIALEAARELGAETQIFAGRELSLPMYTPDTAERSLPTTALVSTLRQADGIVISSPGYHGSVSGLIKNALDYMEDLRDDERPYLEDRAVGCIACAAGWQAAGSTLVTLRSIAHALRGWPTPFGAMVNTTECRFSEGEAPPDVARQLHLIGAQVFEFARVRRASHGTGGDTRVRYAN